MVVAAAVLTAVTAYLVALVVTQTLAAWRLQLVVVVAVVAL